MDDAEAIKWYKRGVTPGWLEHTMKEAEKSYVSPIHGPGMVWIVVATEAGNQIGATVFASHMRALAEYWGIV